jgi:hypothetical protein
MVWVFVKAATFRKIVIYFDVMSFCLMDLSAVSQDSRELPSSGISDEEGRELHDAPNDDDHVIYVFFRRSICIVFETAMNTAKSCESIELIDFFCLRCQRDVTVHSVAE